MSTKDYIIIAAAIKKAHDTNWDAETVVQNIADALAIDNHRFNRAQFMQACGIE